MNLIVMHYFQMHFVDKFLSNYDRMLEEGLDYSETKHFPSRVVSWGYDLLEEKLMEEKQKKKLEQVA